MNSRQLIEHVAAQHGITRPDIIGKSRRADVSQARADCVVDLRDILHLSWPAIGRCINRSHTTAIYLYRTADVDRMAKTL